MGRGVILGLFKHLFDRFLNKLVGTSLVKHLKGRINPQFKSVGTQDARAHTVNSGDPGPVHLGGLSGQPFSLKGSFHPCLDLTRRLIGKGNGKHLINAVKEASAIGGRTLHEGPGNTLCEREGLAASRPRRHRKRLIEGSHAGELTWFECAEIHEPIPAFLSTKSQDNTCIPLGCWDAESHHQQAYPR